MSETNLNSENTTRTSADIFQDYNVADYHGNGWANETWMKDGDGRILLSHIAKLEAELALLRPK